jgi:sugar phosphate isomerase/epimerase
MGIKRSVSMYSLQDEYVRGKMNLEAMFKELKSLGADLEFITDQMMHNSPFPREETLQEWDRLIEKYQVKPMCNDIFINTTLYKNRVLTDWEATDLLIHEIKLANRLGFPVVRLVSETPAEIIEPALKYAEKYNVVLALEIHAGMSFDNPKTKAFTDIMFRLNSKYLGLVVDTGIFCRRHPRVSKNYFLELGLNPEVAEYIDNVFAKGTDPIRYIGDGFYTGGEHGPKYPEDLVKLLKSHVDREYCLFSCGYENSDLSILDKYLPYIVHFHGKIYEMTEAGEYSIDFEEIIAYLSKKNWSGYISTEYEGNRFALQGQDVDALSHVRRHQKLLKDLIEKYENKAGENNV